MSGEKFPDSIYVRLEPDGAHSILIADQDINSLGLTIGETARVAVYRLAKVGEVDVVTRWHEPKDVA